MTRWQFNSFCGRYGFLKILLTFRKSSEDSDPNNPRDHEKFATELLFRAVSNEDCFLDFSSLVVLSSSFVLRAIFPDLQVLNIARSYLSVIPKKSLAGLSEINLSLNLLKSLNIRVHVLGQPGT